MKEVEMVEKWKILLLIQIKTKENKYKYKTI